MPNAVGIVHIMRSTHTLCGLDWLRLPLGHEADRWTTVRDDEHATCQPCRVAFASGAHLVERRDAAEGES